MNTGWRILFAGTPAIAVPALRTLASTGRVVGLLCAPDQASGRGRHLQACETKILAGELGIPVFQPSRLDGSAREAVAPLQADILVCLAYGRIFGPRFLQLFPQGGINLHPSLLPRWRGPSPLNAAIMAGDRVTGVTVQRLSAELDAGDILSQEEIPLGGNETAASLGVLAGEKGARMLLSTVLAMEAGLVQPRPQDHSQASYCHLLHKEDGKIDWTRSAQDIHALVRGLFPWPRGWTLWEGRKLYLEEVSLPWDLHRFSLHLHEKPAPGHLPGQVVKVDKTEGYLIQTGDGILGVRRLQLESKKSMDHMAFHNGAATLAQARLGE